MKAIIWAALGALAVSGCSFSGDSFSEATELQPSLTNERITESTDATESALGALYTRASLFEEPKPGSAQWDAVIMAGMDYVDESCGDYLNAVYLAHRNKDATPSFGSSIASLFGGSTVSGSAFGAPEDRSTRMAVKKAEPQPEPLGIEAAKFHAANEDSRKAYRKSLFAGGRASKRREKFAALAAIRGYANLCSASAVEAQLAKATAAGSADR